MCQVPTSQGRGGAVNAAVALEVVLVLVVGARRVIEGGRVEGAGSEDDMFGARRQGAYV
jgi:hypothetical protein